MKKIIVLLTTILIIGLTFTSCAGKENESEKAFSDQKIDVENTNTESTVDEGKMIQTEATGTMEMKEEMEQLQVTTEAEVTQDMLAQEAAKEMEATAGRKLPTISFKSVDFKAVPIKQGTQITHNYEFKNTGEAPLKIEYVRPSCGCMSLNYPEEAIAPGEKQTISVTFDSKGKEGMQKKTVSVKTNAIPSVQVLNFTLEVLRN